MVKLDNILAKGVLKETILFIPNFVKLLYRLMQDSRVTSTDKALVAATIAYVLSPWDLVPDVIPFFGQLDDLLLVALVLKRLMDSVEEEVLIEYWDGNEDLILTIEKITDLAVRFLPPKIYDKLIKKSRPGTIDVDFEVK
ncbi:MAG TPA: YkvA family protein [Syntrophomonadaceae bacterium]|nr:YkvA family protein [Syntrophomonadaceae bacterium]